MADASRRSRAPAEARAAGHRIIRELSASVAGPVLTGYVLWLLRRARELGLARLYFVSRDGQILRQIAQRVAAKLGMDVDLRYLYGSRRAWYLPALPLIEDGHLSGMLAGTHVATVRSVLSMISLAPEPIAHALEEIGLPEGQWLRNLSRAERLRLVQHLRRNRQLRGLVDERAAQERRTMLRYLEQEGLLDSMGSGLVDLCGRGTAHEALASVLSTVGARPPAYFYFGVGAGEIGDAATPCEWYFYDRRTGRGFLGVVPRVLLEAFCSGDHGVVLGYQEEQGRMRPRLREDRNQPVLAWGVDTVRATVSSFVDNLALDGVADPWSDVRRASAELLESLWLTPTRAEAEAVGAFPHEDSLTGDHSYPVAEPLRARDLARILRGADLDRPVYWFAGALALSRPDVRLAAKSARMLKGLWGSLGHRRALLGKARWRENAS